MLHVVLYHCIYFKLLLLLTFLIDQLLHLGHVPDDNHYLVVRAENLFKFCKCQHLTFAIASAVIAIIW